MKKTVLALTLLIAGFATTQTYCKKEKKTQTTTTTKKEAPKKAKTKKMSKDESNFWDEKAEFLARAYETDNQDKFENRGGQAKQELEEIRALEGAIKELKTGEKSEFWKEHADSLSAAYTEYHPEVKDAKKAFKKAITILEKKKKSWESEFQIANEDPEAAYLG